MRVKFLLNATAVGENGPEVLFQADEEVDLPEASAERWIRRDAAVEVSKVAKKKRTKKKAG